MTRPRRRIPPLLLAAMLLLAASRASGEGERRVVVNDRCPVMNDEPASPLHEMEFRGVPVRFCCAHCQEDFVEDPSPYLLRLPQLHFATIEGPLSDAQRHARAERAAGWIERWTIPVLLGLTLLVAGLLLRRIVRRVRLAHAAHPALRSAAGGDDHDAELHPAGGPRPHE